MQIASRDGSELDQSLNFHHVHCYNVDGLIVLSVAALSNCARMAPLSDTFATGHAQSSSQAENVHHVIQISVV